MTTLVIPAQQVLLSPCEHDGRYFGEMRIGTVTLHVEAYALDTSSEATEGLLTEANRLASFGEPLETMQVDGRDCVLVVFPKGA